MITVMKEILCQLSIQKHKLWILVKNISIKPLHVVDALLMRTRSYVLNRELSQNIHLNIMAVSTCLSRDTTGFIPSTGIRIRHTCCS